mmetsp:Transcript_11850/g.34859  ORF Transcript_11850/g.34859 Transcript_11850/m.34859 type:complete len:326 (+) Transcript_11850:759-1736(+)
MEAAGRRAARRVAAAAADAVAHHPRARRRVPPAPYPRDRGELFFRRHVADGPHREGPGAELDRRPLRRSALLVGDDDDDRRLRRRVRAHDGRAFLRHLLHDARRARLRLPPRPHTAPPRQSRPVIVADPATERRDQRVDALSQPEARPAGPRARVLLLPVEPDARLRRVGQPRGAAAAPAQGGRGRDQQQDRRDDPLLREGRRVVHRGGRAPAAAGRGGGGRHAHPCGRDWRRDVHCRQRRGGDPLADGQRGLPHAGGRRLLRRDRAAHQGAAHRQLPLAHLLGAVGAGAQGPARRLHRLPGGARGAPHVHDGRARQEDELRARG